MRKREERNRFEKAVYISHLSTVELNVGKQETIDR